MDYYVILGVTRGAGVRDVERAYQRLARRFHPEINPGDRTAADAFAQITAAYQTLVDPVQRRRYDEGGAPLPDTTAPTAGFDGFDFSQTGAGAQAASFGDLFGDLLQRPGQREHATERGADLHHVIELSFDDALRGARRSLTLTRRERCKGCRGAGVRRTPPEACESCGGAGVVRAQRGHMVFSRVCHACGGGGRVTSIECRACGGEGVFAQSETITTSVPAGVADGARIRVHGKGDAGRRGAAAGDLYLEVRVAPHELFRREGDDLHIVVPIAIHEAALGARIETPTPDGAARMRVPPGTQSGQRFRLSGRGAPSPRTGERGDLIVEVRLVLPSVLDERSKDLLREFGRLQTELPRRGLIAGVAAASSGDAAPPR